MSNILTVGMAVYGDQAGAYFTITGLRANHPDCDIIVVDNAPTPDLRTRDVCLANGGRYYHKPNLYGTAAPRDEVFRLSETPWTMCCDSHVIFETGAIQALIDYAELHPDSNDIISGPLVYDNGVEVTHWRPTNPPGLWGVWMDAWTNGHIDLNKMLLDVFDPIQTGERVHCAATMGGSTVPPPANRTFDQHKWREELRALGCIPASEHHMPFEIPSMGLGAWAMRTEAWPGFNPLFNGFGGEEGYIHELVRRKGGKAICLPALRWRHWFRDGISPVPYPHSYEHFLWNLLVSHRELGIDALPQIKAHADTGARVTQEQFDSMVRGVNKCVPFNEPGWRPAPLKVLGIWYSNNAAPQKVLKASLDSIKRAKDLSRADVTVVTCPWDRIEGNPFVEVLATHNRNESGHLMIVKQQKQCLDTIHNLSEHWRPDVVCFLEHDVLYPPDYFDRVARAFRENPDANVVSNLDYEGLNETGWLKVRERHEPLHQLSMRYDLVLKNLERCEKEARETGICLLEPQGDRRDWVRIPPNGRMPSIHIGHEKRLTSHHEVVFHAHSNGQITHPFWGKASDYWTGKDITPPVSLPPGCNTCGGNALPPPPPFTSLDEWYADAQGRPSDFHQHVKTLKELADSCETVAELSLWDDKPATVALAASSAKKVISVRMLPKRIWGPIKSLRPDFIGSNDDGDIRDGVDLLFLDENHRAQELYDSLSKYAPHVSRYLVVHCTTEPFGETGDDGGPGVMPGVRRFLNENREWTAIRHDKNNHGLIVLSKADEDRKQPPGTLRKAMNFTKALAKHAKNGARLVKDHVHELRMAECLTCPERAADVCSKCGCPVEAKTSWASEKCPLDPPKWGIVTEPSEIE